MEAPSFTRSKINGKMLVLDSSSAEEEDCVGGMAFAALAYSSAASS